MAFYVGCYLIDQDVLEPRHTAWFMPDDATQHMAETSNVEELQILPTDMDSIPTQIQFGACTWTDDEGFTADDPYKEFYPNPQAFYVRGFSAGTGYYQTFYPNPQAFYVRNWTSGTGYYDAFYPDPGAFYVRNWTSGSGQYREFYPNPQSFYVRNFSAIGTTWNTFYAPTC